jgi:hypothetical protein
MFLRTFKATLGVLAACLFTFLVLLIGALVLAFGFATR